MIVDGKNAIEGKSARFLIENMKVSPLFHTKDDSMILIDNTLFDKIKSISGNDIYSIIKIKPLVINLENIMLSIIIKREDFYETIVVKMDEVFIVHLKEKKTLIFVPADGKYALKTTLSKSDVDKLILALGSSIDMYREINDVRQL